MAVKIETLELEIKSQAEQASKGIDQLSNSLRSLKKGALNARSLNTLSRNLMSLNNALKAIENSEVTKINKLSHAMQRLAKASSQLKGVGGIGKNIRGISKAVSAGGTQAGKSKAVGSSSNIDTVKDNLKESTSTPTFYNKLSTAVNNSAKAFGRLASSFGRIALYRAIRSVIKGITTAISEGTNNIYQYSKALDSSNGGQFAKNMDSIASSIITFKNSIGAVLVPIVNSLTPVFNTIMNGAIKAGNAIARFLAIISGKSTYTKAIAYNTQFAESATKSAGAVSEAVKDATAGIDELNVISQQSASGGAGSGGGGGTDDFSKMFEETGVGEVSNFLSNLKLSIDDVLFDWDDLNTEQIAEKAISGLLGLGGFGAGVALTGSLAGGLALAIAGVALGLVISAYTFNRDGVIDEEERLQLISLAVGAIAGGGLGAIIGGFGGASVGIILGTSIAFALNQYTFNKDGEVSEDERNKLLTFAVNALIGAGIGAYIGGKASGGSASGIAKGASIGITLATVVTFAIEDFVVEPNGGKAGGLEGFGEGFGSNLFDFSDLSEAWDGFKESWDEVFTSESLEELGYNIIDGIGHGLDLGITAVFQPIDRVVEAIIGGIKGLLGIESPSTVMRDEVGVNIVEGIRLGIEEKWGGISTAFDTKFSALKLQIDGKWNLIKENTGTKWNEIKEKLSSTWDNIKTDSGTKFDEIKEKVIGAWEGVKEGIKNPINGIITAVENMINFCIRGINHLIDKLNEFIGDSFISDAIEEFTGSVVKIPSLAEISLPRLAKGGSVTAGDLFLANENAPELIGTSGNRTSVMSNQDIIDSITLGVYDAVVSAMGQSNSAPQQVQVFLNGKQIESSTRQTKQRRGVSIATGGIYNYT